VTNLDSVLNPPLPIALDEFYKTLLSVSGVLFGIAFAAMLFVLQSGFASFKFSRRMFLELYLHFGRQLLYSLAYLTAAPFVILFFSDSTHLISWLYALYLVYFLNATLDYAKEEGYILMLHSNKFVPRHYGRIRSYFRYIKNRGVLRNLLFLFPVILFLVYPYVISVHESLSLYLTKTAVFYSCLIPLLYTLYKTTKFIPEFFMYTGMELSSNAKEPGQEKTEEEKQKNRIEKVALKEYLSNHGLSELDPATPYHFIDGDLSVFFLEDKDSSEAWFNINVNIANATPDLIRKRVLEYAHKFAKLLYMSKVEINTFVLSFHVHIGKQASRNVFFRVTRNELDKVFAPGRNEPEDMAGLKNVLFDELFR
jgi:MFS family permease